MQLPDASVARAAEIESERRCYRQGATSLRWTNSNSRQPRAAQRASRSHPRCQGISCSDTGE